MKKRHLYVYFEYLVEHDKKLSNLTYLEIRFIFNLISMLDNNYCSKNMLYGSSAVYSLAYRCNIHQIKVIQLLKEITAKGFLISCRVEYGYYYTLAVKKISKYYLNRLKKDKKFRNIVVNIEFLRDLSNDFYCNF